MTYSANIPQSTDDPSQSQPLILANFQQLNSQYGSSGDHIEFTASSGNGKHKKVTWLDQTSSVPSAGVSEIVAYGLTQSGVTMPYYKRDGLATQYSLSPIKAYGVCSITSNTTGTLLDSFNLTLGSVSLNSTRVWVLTFSFTNAMRSATNYGIQMTGTQILSVYHVTDVNYTIIDASNFSVRVSTDLTPGFPFGFTVMALET